MALIVDFEKISQRDIKQVGGKVASLGEMIRHLRRKKLLVPGGFCVTSEAFNHFLDTNQLRQNIYSALDAISVDDMVALRREAKKIRRWILEASMPPDLERVILQAFSKLKQQGCTRVAVRSSATCEDLPNASFAGLHNTFLHIKSQAELLQCVKQVFASLYNERAIAYRAHHHFSEQSVSMAAGVQMMVSSDQAVSGVMFTLDTESGFDQVVLINASYGLGEAIVSGQVNPDEYVVFKPMVNRKKQSILRRTVGGKDKKIVMQSGRLQSRAVPKSLQHQLCLRDEDVVLLAKQALVIEQHYGCPMDIEWAQDGKTKQFYIVQARPETVESQKQQAVMIQYQFQSKGKVLCSGRSVGHGVGAGKANVITAAKDIAQFKLGSVLVTDITNPDWEPIMKQASAIVTNRGGRTCHAAIIARELGIPAVVGAGNATEVIRSGADITVSCAEGDDGFVYEGIANYKANEVALKKLPKLPVDITMNLGNPDRAFLYQAIPNQGVGLARLEFIIGNMIQVHPQALLGYASLPKSVKAQIAPLIAAYSSPVEYYVEKLREGMAMIAAAFYPKPVIFRFSDFKSNEYANLLGGDLFEPTEDNPMLGYRGAARYVSEAFEPSFALECEALKRLRQQSGLDNAQVMIPFTRTVEEAKQVLALMKKYGLVRGRRGLKVYMMCEIPSNVVLAEAFLQHFDGYSIGSNDLTQLTFGLDRDSELVAHLFDERNPAMLSLLAQVIKICRREKKYVGICGQGPSDFPDFADWLVGEGIKSMSLSPDSIVKTWDYLAKRRS